MSNEIIPDIERKNQESNLRFIKWFRLGYHTTLTGTYLHSIVFQFVKASQSGKSVFSLFKFLTFQCQVLQFGSYGLCIVSHFNHSFIRPRDLLFTSLAFPISKVVFIIFWTVFSIDRELIYPLQLETSGYFPAWLNQINHTLILPANVIEFFLVNHKQATGKQAMKTLGTFALQYTILTSIHRYVTGNFVYPFLDKLNVPSSVVFIAASVGFAGICFKTGSVVNKYLSKLRHRFIGDDDSIKSDGSTLALDREKKMEN